MTIHSINAPYSTFNSVSGNSYTISQVESPSTTPQGASPSRLLFNHAFNEAPVDLLSVHFTGRQKELACIARTFDRVRGDVPIRCVLFGDQGVGKSQLTFEWAKSTFALRQNSYILWISATTVEKVYQGYCKLLQLVGHPDRSHPDQSTRLTAARRWLEEVDTGNWLLILDNVFGETLGFLREHLPRYNGRGTMLFTTRTRSVAIALASARGEQHEIIEVPILEVEEAVELFLGHFNDGEIKEPSSKVEVMVKSVGCLPLAISHATAYMKQSRSTLDDMLMLYQGKDKFDLISWENHLSDYEHKSVAATFTFQLENLERQRSEVSNLLRVLAFFDPESIPLEMLITGANAISESQVQAPSDGAGSAPQKAHSFMRRIMNKIFRRGERKRKRRADEVDATPILPSKTTSLLALIQSPTGLRSAIAELQNSSLTAYQRNTEHPTLQIHDLIQLVVLEDTKKAGADQELFELATELACSAFGRIKNPKLPGCWPQCEVLIPHIQSLTAHQKVSSTAKASLLLANGNIARYLQSRGRYGEAEKLCEEVLADRKQLLGLKHLQTLAAMHNLASIYSSQGRYNDAESMFKEVLSSRQKQLGLEHDDTTSTMGNLALVYSYQGRYNDAEALFKQVMEVEEKRFGSQHVKTLATVHNLALVYESQGRYNDAETLINQVLQGYEKPLGLHHVHTLKTMHRLAVVYLSQGRYKDSEELLDRVRSGQEKQLGPEHVDTLTTTNTLAIVYGRQKRYDDAEALFNQVLLANERQLGSEHIHTLMTMHNVASVYWHQGRHDDAEKLFKQVLEGQEKQLGAEHVDTLKTMHKLGMVYESQGRYAEAEMLLVHVLAHIAEPLGDSHPHTQSVMHSLASVYTKLGRFEEAEEMKKRTRAGSSAIMVK